MPLTAHVHQALRPNGWEPHPLILDDQALVLHVRDRGLVVLTGCGDAGIVNITRYAGWAAQHALASRLPQAFIPNTVGTHVDLVA